MLACKWTVKIMQLTRTAIFDVILIEPRVFKDDRGYFVETFLRDKLKKFLGFKVNFCQDNESKSSFGVLRGLHYQLPAFSQTKLVRVTQGKVLDVAVDIRKGSPTFGQSVTMEISDENKKQLFIPRGFAHGYVVLSKTAILQYKTDNYYNPKSDRGIAYNDETLNIDWQLPLEQLQLSSKDLHHPNLQEADNTFDYHSNYYQ